jgi:hypothetical protein
MTVRGTDKLLRQLNRLSSEAESTIKDGLKRLSFEVRDAIQTDVANALEYAGPNTKQFVAKFKVKYRTAAGIFEALIYPAGKKSEEILNHHNAANRITLSDKADVGVDGMIAVPIAQAIKRGRSGKIRKADTPAQIMRRNAKGQNRGFRSGSNIMYRLTKGAEPILAYVLKSATPTKKRLDILASAARAVGANAGKAFGKAIHKAMKNVGMK